MPVLEVARFQVHRLRHVPTVGGILRMAEGATPMHMLLTLTEREGEARRKEPKKVAAKNVAAKLEEGRGGCSGRCRRP